MPRPVKTTLLAAALLACSALPARAQYTIRPMPRTGETVRVSPGGEEPYTGRLVALGGDTVLLSVPGDSTRTGIASGQTVEVLRRRREAWSGYGALAGMALGVVTAHLVNGGTGGSPHRVDQTVVAAAAGGVLGGFIGFSVAPARWQRLRAEPRPAAAPVVLPPPPAPSAR